MTFFAAPGLPIVWDSGPKLPAGHTMMISLSTNKSQAIDKISLPSEGYEVVKVIKRMSILISLIKIKSNTSKISEK